MRVEPLGRPLTIDRVMEGSAYRWPAVVLSQTNLFLKVGLLDEVFLKVPTARGFGDYRRFVRDAQPSTEDLRGLEDVERFESLDVLLNRYPGLRRLGRISREVVHYLAVHRLQHERLRSTSAVGIPAARFGVLQTRRYPPKFEPALFQERIEGPTLWEMFDFSDAAVAERWRPCLPAISRQLARLVDSDLQNHIDWNIRNFVFREADARLFYVDLKPSTFVARAGNERNLTGIRDYFLQ